MHVHQLFDLSGKTAIVTGGGRGLGEQIAEGLAEAGAHVAVCSRNADACRETAERLREKGVRTLALACDVTNPEDVRRTVEAVLEHFSSIDILVNNSGTAWAAPALDMPLDAWNRVLATNLTGTFLMCQAAGRVMLEQRRGKIINISSTAGLLGTESHVLDAVGYSASKGGIISLTRDLAVKWGPYNVHVNAIAPGFFPTKLSHQVIRRSEQELLQASPLRRFGGKEDLKGVAVFLASAASDYITGQVLPVDGGSSIK